MSDSITHQTFKAALAYSDGFAALDWLERAFGFNQIVAIPNADGGLLHGEMSFGSGQFAIGTPWMDAVTSPASVGRRNTQILLVHLDEDVDSHYARAIANGAEPVSAPKDQPYGVRSYSVQDLEGHVWTFAQPMAAPL